MARVTRWTDEKIRTIKLPGGKREHRFLVEPSLYLFVRQLANDGFAKQWQYRVQVDGSRLWLSLGSYPGIGYAQARTELLKHQATHEVAKKGEADHPVLVARHTRNQKKAQPTVGEVFDEWIADKRLGSRRKQGKPVRERTVFILTQNFDTDIRARIGDAKIATLVPESFRSCIDAARKRGAPGAAAQVYRVLRGLVLFAVSRGYLVADPMRGIDNPKPYRPQPVVAASDIELRALLRALDSSRLWLATKLAIEFQLLTGARPAEVRLATWNEIDLDRAVWTLPGDRVKSDRAFRVHLSGEALSVLRKALQLTRTDKDLPARFVFPGANGGAMEKMAVARALSRLAGRAPSHERKRLRPHDLRRTFRTMLSRLGVPPHIAELCMNHQETETMRRVYDGHDYFSEMTDAWDKAGASLAALRNGGASVISITVGKRA